MKETYSAILAVSCSLKHMLSNAMVLCQSWGYNGLKRLYRYEFRHIANYMLLLQNEMFDEHELTAMLDSPAYPAYAPKDIKEHIATMYVTMKDVADKLSTLNGDLIKHIGYQSCISKKLLACVYKLKEKSRRLYFRGIEVDWMKHDLHRYDDELHEKIKHKEQKEGY